MTELYIPEAELAQMIQAANAANETLLEMLLMYKRSRDRSKES